MRQIKFTPHGLRDFEALSPQLKQRVHKKLVENVSLPDPLIRAKPLVNLPPTTHRFRVGKYRISFFIKEENVFVERIELRGEAYRG